MFEAVILTVFEKPVLDQPLLGPENSMRVMTTLFIMADKENASRAGKHKWEKHETEKISKRIRTKS